MATVMTVSPKATIPACGTHKLIRMIDPAFQSLSRIVGSHQGISFTLQPALARTGAAAA